VQKFYTPTSLCSLFWNFVFSDTQQKRGACHYLSFRPPIGLGHCLKPHLVSQQAGEARHRSNAVSTSRDLLLFTLNQANLVWVFRPYRGARNYSPLRVLLLLDFSIEEQFPVLLNLSIPHLFLIPGERIGRFGRPRAIGLSSLLPLLFGEYRPSGQACPLDDSIDQAAAVSRDGHCTLDQFPLVAPPFLLSGLQEQADRRDELRRLAPPVLVSLSLQPVLEFLEPLFGRLLVGLLLALPARGVPSRNAVLVVLVPEDHEDRPDSVLGFFLEADFFRLRFLSRLEFHGAVPRGGCEASGDRERDEEHFYSFSPTVGYRVGRVGRFARQNVKYMRITNGTNTANYIGIVFSVLTGARCAIKRPSVFYPASGARTTAQA